MGRRIVLQGMEPPLTGLSWEFEKHLRIGRQSNQELVLEHPSVSRQHAEIYPSRVGWVIRDLGSGAPTWVNGVKVVGAERKLEAQDVLQIGNLALQVAVLEDEVMSAVPPAPTRDQKHVKTSGEFLVRVQATTKRSWEKGIETLAAENNPQLERGKHFLTLLRGGYHLSNVAAMDVMLQSVLDDGVAVLNAQRGCIVLMDEKTGQLEERAVSVTRSSLKKAKSYSKTLAQRCVSQGESLLCRDVKTDTALQTAGSVLQGTMASIICALFRSPRRRLGILHLDRGPLQPPFGEEEFILADGIAASVSIGIETALMLEDQRQDFVRAVSAFVSTVEARAPYLAGHADRVAAHAALLAEELQLPVAERWPLQLGARAHDIGKALLPDELLRKPGALTAAEQTEARGHAAKGATLLEGIPTLALILPIIRNHHERWDGTGYPDGLAGEKIPRAARIVALANAIDGWTTARPYRPALALKDAAAKIIAASGQAFDPAIVQAFQRAQPRLEAAATTAK